MVDLSASRYYTIGRKWQVKIKLRYDELIFQMTSKTDSLLEAGNISEGVRRRWQITHLKNFNKILLKTARYSEK